MNAIKKIGNNPLFKVTSLNGLSIVLKIAIGFITSKVIAVCIGPSGMALVGNLRNFLSSTEALSTLGFENGVVKYVAEHKAERLKLNATLATVFISVLLTSLCIGLGLIFFSSYFNKILFGTTYSFQFIFGVLAVALPFYIGNIFLIATLNGLGHYKKVIYINSIGSCLGLLITVFLIWNFSIQGALVAIVATPTVLFFVSFLFVYKEIAIFKAVRFRFFALSELKNLSSYTLMALVSALIGPMVMLAIRKNCITVLGIEQAGFWESMTRIASYYFLFITSILGIYYLPKLALAKNNLETKVLFWNYYKGILPVFVFGLVVLYFLRNFVVELLFTKEFLPVAKLFFWQLLGDFFKAASFVLGYQFYAKKLTKAFLISEICSLTILYFSSVYFTSIYSLQGVVMAHALTYFIYLLSLTIYFRKSLFA